MAKKKARTAPDTAAPAAPPTPPAAETGGPPGPLAALEGPRGRFAWPVLFLVLFPLYLTCASNDFGGGLGGDNVVYFLLGKAIATGQGYVDLYLPGNPPHAKYPPLFPLLLAPFHLLFDRPLLPMHVMLIAFNALAVVLAGMVSAKMAGSRRAGLAVALLFGLGSRMYLQNLHLLSEPPYMFFCFLALLLLPGKKGRDLPPGRVAAIGLCAAAAFFTRTMGIAVVAAVTAGLWFNRASFTVKDKRLPAAPAALAVWLLAFALWSVRNRLAGAGGEYANELLYLDPYRPDLGLIGVGGYFARIGKNLAYYYQQSAAYLVTDYQGPLPVARTVLAVGYGLPFLMLFGLGLTIHRGERAVATFCAATLFIVFSWSFIDPRFLAPAWPFLFHYLLAALDGIGRLVRLKRPWVPAVTVAALTIVFAAAQLPDHVRFRFLDLTQPVHPVKVEGLPHLFDERLINYAKYESAPSVAARPDVVPQRVNFLIINRVAAELTPPEAVIVSRKPMYTYLLSGRKSVPLLPSEDPDKQWAFMEKNRVDYIVTGVGEEVLQPTLQRFPDRFSLSAALGNSAYLIRVNR